MRNGIALSVTKSLGIDSLPTPTLAYNFLAGTLAPEFGSQAITFTRASTAWAFNASRLLVSAASNAVRYDYDPITGAALGFLHEGAQTNRVLQNRDLTQTAWTKALCTAAKNQSGIDGVSNSASSLTATLANATCTQSITVASDTYAITAYLKRITGTGNIEMTRDGGSTWVDVTSQMLGTGPNGFSRVTIAKATLANPAVGFRLGTMGDAIAVDAVQLESRRNTSPILTTTAVVTRAADLATFDPVGVYSDTGCSVFEELRLGDYFTTGYIFSLQDSALTNSVTDYHNSAANSLRLVTSGGCNIAVAASSVDCKTANRCRLNDFQKSASGATSTGDNSGTMPTNASITLGAIGSLHAGSNPYYGHIKRLRFWNMPLSNSQLQGLIA